MMGYRSRVFVMALCAVLAATCCISGRCVADTGDVPRVLLVGDSWTGFLMAFRSFNQKFKETPGLEQFTEVGYKTAIMGGHATEYDSPEKLQVVQEELEANPTIDVVHMCLGGNDFLDSSEGYRPTVPPAELTARYNALITHLSNIMDFILAVRPNIRIVYSNYTYGDHSVGGTTTQQLSELGSFEAMVRDMSLAKGSRVGYVNAMGLMHYHYGVWVDADPGTVEGQDQITAAHTLSMPGNHDSVPPWTPWLGGDPTHCDPHISLVDNDIHLTLDGYQHLLDLCFDEYYTEIFSYPIVTGIVRQSENATQAVFQVTFSKAVTGVDATDFGVTATGGAPAVTGVSGSDTTYTVTVTLNGGTNAALSVLDDDSIVDGSSNPLGGPGADNGGFSFNGVLNYQDIPRPTPGDFDAALTYFDAASQPYLAQLGGYSFNPAVLDANGGTIVIEPLFIGGNGLLESVEFGLIRAALDDADLDLSSTGGVTHALIQAAWDNNYQMMLTQLGGPTALGQIMLPGLDTFLAGYMTLGDPNSVGLVAALFILLKGIEDFDTGITGLLSPYLYTSLPQYFGLNGDADGDGYTNLQEYEYYYYLGGRNMYLQAALDPNMGLEGVDCLNHAGGVYNEGDEWCVSVPPPKDDNGGFQWYKDSDALTDGGFIEGAQSVALHITFLRPEDSGLYTCQYDDGSKAAAVFGPVELTVVQMPITGGVGLALLLAVTASSGFVALRRRK